jgi:predicted nucleic acid-binding protein
MKLLVDTSALLALYLKSDRNHRPAVAFTRRNLQARYVLTDLVLAELATRLRAAGGAERAVAVASDLMRSRRYELLFVDAELFQEALAEMVRYADKLLSLADCASFAAMKRLKLDAAFSFDRDFRDCGFRMLPA